MTGQQQFGDWAAELKALTLTEALHLDCDLHLTRAIFTPSLEGNLSASVFYKINDGKQYKLCELDNRTSTVEMDKVFASGNSVQFAVRKLGPLCSVRLEGYFGFASTNQTLSDQMTGVERRLALHVTATANDLGKQIEFVNTTQRETIIRLEAELKTATEENNRLQEQVTGLIDKQKLLEDWIITLQQNLTRC